MEHNTAGAGSFQRRRADSMRQTAYKGGGKARREAGDAEAGPEAGTAFPADEAARRRPRAKEKAFRGRTAKPGGRPGLQRRARRQAQPFQRMRQRARNAGPS